MSVVQPWIENKLKELLGFDDEIITNFITNFLEKGSEDINGPDPRDLQL